VAEGETKLTFDSLLEMSVRRPLPKTSRPSGQLLVALLPVCRDRRMNTTKIRPVLATIPIIVGASGAA
jgi:hypothetical protein